MLPCDRDTSSRNRWHLLGTRDRTGVECVEDLLSALYADPVVLIPFVAGDDRFTHPKSVRELALGQPAGNSGGNEQTAKIGQAQNDREVSPSCVLVPLDLVLELGVE